MHRTVISRVAIVGLAVILAAEAHGATQEPKGQAAAEASTGEWPFYRGDPGLTGVASGALGDSPELAWSYETRGAVTSSPVVSGGLVHVGSIDGKLHTIDQGTGKMVWSYGTEDAIEAPPFVHRGRVYFGGCDGIFYALDAKTGRFLWKFETGDKIMASANVARLANGEERIVVGSYDGHLYCYDMAGQKQWAYATDNYVNGTAAIWNGMAVFGGCDAFLHVVNIATGEAERKIDLGPDCQVPGSVSVADGKAFVGHYGNALVAIDLKTEQADWVYQHPRHPFYSSPTVGSRQVLIGCRDRHLHCIDRKTGKKTWSFPTKRKIDASATICGDKAVFGSGDGRVYLVNLADGKLVWKYELGRAILSSPAIVGDMFFIGSNDKRLYAFKAPR